MLRSTRCTIKVRGGKLFYREISDDSIVTNKGVALVKDCPLVRGLGVNLMSVKKARAHARWKGHFGDKTLFKQKIITLSI